MVYPTIGKKTRKYMICGEGEGRMRILNYFRPRVHRNQRLRVAARFGSALVWRPVVAGGGAPMLNNAPPPPPEPAVPPNENVALFVAGEAGKPDTLPAGEAG